ncbi:glycosyltransferase family 2 protein [Candidatus Microgenomates bacterium]|nr:glycosyltransferase family 2 protein [Candidatus Microgenomates bacterium]
MKTTLVILTKNEVQGVNAVVPKIPRGAVDEIIAVDGGSTDGTREAFKSIGIDIVPQKSPGRGEAFRIAAEKSQGDILIFFSPDGNENPNDIPKFRKYFEEGADIVIASRMMKGAHNEEDESTFPVRKWVNQAFGLIANILWNRSGKFVTDTINGYRAIRKDVFKELKLDGPGYTIEYQMSIRALKHRKKIVEFPTYESGRIGPGGSPSLTTGIAFIKCLWREIMLSFKKRI